MPMVNQPAAAKVLISYQISRLNEYFLFKTGTGIKNAVISLFPAGFLLF